MKAVDFENIRVGDRIIVDLTDAVGDHSYTILEVRGINKNRSIKSNLNGGINIFPNEHEQYILVDYFGEEDYYL